MIMRVGISNGKIDRNIGKELRLRQFIKMLVQIRTGMKDLYQQALNAAAGRIGVSVRPSAFVVAVAHS